MATPAALVDRALKNAGVPIDGVTLGDPLVRATWTVQYAATATPAHKATGAALLLTIPIDGPAQLAQDDLDAQLAVDAIPLVIKALALALIDETNRLRAALTVLGAPGLPPITIPQALAAIRAKAGLL